MTGYKHYIIESWGEATVTIASVLNLIILGIAFIDVMKLDHKDGFKEDIEQIDSEIRKIIENAHKEAVDLIKKNKEDVILIAKTLLEHEQITAEEIDYLLEHRHLKRDEKKPVENVKDDTATAETVETITVEETK